MGGAGVRAELLLGALERRQRGCTASQDLQRLGAETPAEPAGASMLREGGGACASSSDAGASLSARGAGGGGHAAPASAPGADARAYLGQEVQYEGGQGAERLVDSEGKAVMMR